MPIDQALSSLMSELSNEAEPTKPEKEIEEAEEALNQNESDEFEVEEPAENESEESTLLITKEMAKEAGIPKELVGKPVSELAKSYRNLLTDYTKKTSELSELKKVQAKSTPADETDEDEIPDPVEDIEGFRKWLKNNSTPNSKKLEQELEYIEDIEGFRKWLKNNSTPNSKKLEQELEYIENARKAQTVKETFDVIADSVGKKVDIKTLIDEWSEHSELSEADYDVYLSNPKRIIKPVIDYYYAKAYKNQFLKEKAKVNEAEILKQKSIKEDGSKLVSYGKSTTSTNSTAVQRLLKDLQS